MPSNIIVNFLTTQHKVSTGVTMGFPDVCKTPAPPAPAPVPIPYPNVAMSTMASFKVTMRVKDDKQKVVVKGSAYTMSSGDEPGVALGIISSKIKGKSEIMNTSFNVKFEGKGVGRLTDPHGNNSGSPSNVPNPAEAQPPSLAMPGMSADQKKACEEVDKKRAKDEAERKQFAEDGGMLPEHAESISNTCKYTKHSATFRSTNKECADKIAAGFPAKGCDVAEKTVSDKTIGMADSAAKQKIDDWGLKGFVGAYEKGPDGKPTKLTGLKTTDGEIPFDQLKNKPPPPNNIYTGDYDAHDMFDRKGQRIRDGSQAESKFQRSLNRGIGRGEPGPGKDMVRHGPQNNYKDYWERKGKKEGKPFVPSLAKPDVSPKEPLLAFDANGEMYKLETEDELRDYYKCKGAETPPEWGDRTEIPPDRKDKILNGERVFEDGNPTNRIIGAHSADVLNRDDMAVQILATHPNGTKKVKLVQEFADGKISKNKTSTLFPAKWDSEKIMDATKKVGNTPGVKEIRENGTYVTHHTGVVDGVPMKVIKEGNIVTASFPTGL